MIVLILIVVCVILAYQLTTRNHDYWAKRNVKHDHPLPFFGNHLQNFLVRRTVPEIGLQMYNKYRGEKIVGYYRGSTPELIIRDPAIVRHILSSDFKSFPERGGIENPTNDPLLRNLLFTSVEKWRVMRQQVVPGLTRSKVRDMFPMQLECIEELMRTVESHATRQEDVNAFDMMARYTLQSIGFCCFGVDLNAITEQCIFTKQAKSFFVRTKPQIFIMVLAELIPWMTRLFTHKVVSEVLEREVIEMTRKVREERDLKPSERNDFMDVLLELEAQGKLLVDDAIDPGKEDKENDPDTNLKYAAAQLFLFLIGGFETSGTAMSATLHQLAYHPDIQLQVQQEIDQVVSKNNGFTYECLAELTQLEMAFKESIRILSPFGSFRRICAEKYTIPGTEVTIDSGVRIFIPVQALHKDPEYFEDPKEFRPQRFSPQADRKPSNYTYMAFGEGPRKCIGAKLAQMMASAGLAAILKRYTVVPAPSSSYRLTVKRTSYLAQIVDGGFPVRFIPRESV